MVVDLDPVLEKTYLSMFIDQSYDKVLIWLILHRKKKVKGSFYMIEIRSDPTWIVFQGFDPNPGFFLTIHDLQT